MEFVSVEQLTYNDATFPITLADVKFHSKWFNENADDTTLDNYITNFRIPQAVKSFESATGFLIQDQTYSATINSLQSPIYQGFRAGLIHLNVRSVNDVLYFPCGWNGIDARSILDTENYIFTEASGNVAKHFYLKACSFSFYEIENNIKVSYSAGYENNNFTNIPKDIKNCLAMHSADVIDIKKGLCDGQGQHDGWIAQTVSKYRRK
jgi:hypothetical protein